MNIKKLILKKQKHEELKPVSLNIDLTDLLNHIKTKPMDKSFHMKLEEIFGKFYFDTIEQAPEDKKESFRSTLKRFIFIKITDIILYESGVDEIGLAQKELETIIEYLKQAILKENKGDKK